MAKTTDNSDLRKYLDNLPLLEEEKAMWLDAGFFADPQANFNQSLYPGIIFANGTRQATNREIIIGLRYAVINRWEKTHNQAGVRIVEVDSVREDLQARNE